MQATHPDAFALKNSGLDAFLYADVGREMNGSMLTILSMVARLGRDPWAEAAKWAALPRPGVIDSLAQSIDQMPLVPSALAESHVTAARLVQLLPGAAQGLWQSGGAKAETTSVPKWVPITLLYCVLAVGMALNAVLMSNIQSTQAVSAPMAAIGSQSVSLPHRVTVAGPPAATVGP